MVVTHDAEQNTRANSEIFNKHSKAYIHKKQIPPTIPIDQCVYPRHRISINLYPMDPIAYIVKNSLIFTNTSPLSLGIIAQKAENIQSEKEIVDIKKCWWYNYANRSIKYLPRLF